MEGFMQWRIAPWQRVAITRFFALGPALAVAVAGSTSPAVLSVVNEWLNVLQSVQLPFALLPILIYTNKATVMATFKNGRVMRVGLWLMALLVLVINVYTVVTYLTDPASPMPHTWWFYTIVAVYGLGYFVFIAFLVASPLVIGPITTAVNFFRNRGTADGERALLAADDQGSGDV